MAEIDERATGLYHKFNVTRTDGSSSTGGKHEGCSYFVLDLDHDPHAAPALRAYAASCGIDYPCLACDLEAASEAAEARETRLREALQTIVQSMRAAQPYKSHDLGYADSISSNRVEEWADEIDALLVSGDGET